jgi:RecA-family ATPase
MRSVSWLWPNRIALGKVTMLAGEGGLGKTNVLMDIAARCTRGGTWPDGAGNAPAGKVLILTGEDDPEDTIAPRLEAAGGDRSQVLTIEMVRESDGSERSFNV